MNKVWRMKVIFRMQIKILYKLILLYLVAVVEHAKVANQVVEFLEA